MIRPGLVLVITGPSGAGKSSIIHAVLEAEPGLSFSVSHTTRPPRPDEREGVDYHFVGKEAFERLRSAGGFLEWAEVHGHFYGTSFSELESAERSGKSILLDIDVQGAAQVAQRLPGCPSVFILPPDYQSLADRLKGRGTEDQSDLVRRLRNAAWEVRRWESFDYLVVNDALGRAVAEIRAILAAERLRTARRRAAAEKILSTFPLRGGPAATSSGPSSGLTSASDAGPASGDVESAPDRRPKRES